MEEQNLLIIGKGRLATHLQHFYPLLTGHKITQWDRSQPWSSLEEKLAQASHIGLAISDASLPEVAKKIQGQSSAFIFHFSGATHIDKIPCAHPLMTFGPHVFPEIEVYKQITFAVTGASSLQDLLPGLRNSWFPLEGSQKALYHAWCVMAGNFPMLLWQEMNRQFDELQVPVEGRKLYIQQVATRYLQSGAEALTGPLIRKDAGTIQANLKSLDDSKWKYVYQSFVEATK